MIMADDVNPVMTLLVDLNRKQDDQTDKLHAIDIKLGEYNHQLGVHIEGVKELKRITSATDTEVKSVTKRVESLEAPRKALNTFKRFLIEFGKIVTASVALYGFIRWLFPHI
jgi:hypothetical protein